MHKKILLAFLGLILAGMGLSTWALAQPGMQPRLQPGMQPGAEPGGFQHRFAEIKRAQLGPTLGVNQQTVDQLLQIEQRYRPLRQQLIGDAKSDFQRLEQAMSQPNPSNQEVKTILDNIKRKEQEMHTLKQRQDQEEMAILNPVQYAKYMLYQRTLMREARSVKGGPGRAAPMVPKPPTELPVSRPGR